MNASSRILYRIDHYSSGAGFAMVALGVFVCLIIIGLVLGFPSGWLTSFEVSTSSLTFIFVVAIQHTQTREQAATQRKLDELLRSSPRASNELMLLEEASTEVIQEIEADQRRVSLGTDVD